MEPKVFLSKGTVSLIKARRPSDDPLLCISALIHSILLSPQYVPPHLFLSFCPSTDTSLSLACNCFSRKLKSVRRSADYLGFLFLRLANTKAHMHTSAHTHTQTKINCTSFTRAHIYQNWKRRLPWKCF